MRRRFIESFREQKDFICATIGENKLEGFMTNDLEGRKYNKNRIHDYINETEAQARLSRRTTSVTRNVMNSFMMKKNRSLVMKSFMEMKTLVNQKQVG